MADMELFAETSVDQAITRFASSEIQYYPYEAGVPDEYGQRDESFGTPVTIIGRAILDPTKEKISVIGDNEKWEIAFLFSRLEMVRKFPAAVEGEWINTYGQMSWNNRRFKLERVHPTMQVKTRFVGVVALGMTIEGQRNG